MVSCILLYHDNKKTYIRSSLLDENARKEVVKGFNLVDSLRYHIDKEWLSYFSELKTKLYRLLSSSKDFI